jgi:DNA-binding MarR family transcriptional regulator
MNALELYQVGRWMTKLAEDAMRPPDAPVTPPGARAIMTDAFAHPDSSVGEIAARTALPQGYVSSTVSRLREQGVFETRPDPADRRRTLVRVSDTIPETVTKLGAVSIDDILLGQLRRCDDQLNARLIELLEIVAACLRIMREDSGADRLNLL